MQELSAGIRLAELHVAKPESIESFGEETAVSSWMEYDIEVLANDSQELDEIAENLRKPTKAVLNWLAAA